MSTNNSPANLPAIQLVAPSLLVFGGGGHGCVVADAALRSGQWQSMLASDRNALRCNGELLPDVPLYPPTRLADYRGSLHVAIGDNAAREREWTALGADGAVTIQHPQASVSSHALVAAGCFVAAQAVVAPGAELSFGVIVNHAAVVDHDARVGAFTHIAPGVRLGGGVQIGARVLVATGAVVLPGLSICDGALIGAGAVVCASVTHPGTYVGVPARRVK
jgi:sugar O-acyltransferase (sialic acid O-acetyltransferase NeuD family)